MRRIHDCDIPDENGTDADKIASHSGFSRFGPGETYFIPMKRLGDNPPARHPDRPIEAATEPWWVVKVKPRQEKALAADFLHNNIEYYLPMFTKVTRRADNNKPRKSVLPLFPGYIAFAMQTPQNIYTTGRVVNLVEIRHQKRFIAELGGIYRALTNGASIEPYTEHLPPGSLVEVVSGPMRGIQGIVVKEHGGGKLIISVEALGRASVAIHLRAVRPVENKAPH
jgi:transcription antitermination factor NusG